MARFGDLAEGLTILAKYDKDGLKGHVNGAEHDIVYGAFDSEKISEEDKNRLIDLGWHIDHECWCHFC